MMFEFRELASKLLKISLAKQFFVNAKSQCSNNEQHYFVYNLSHAYYGCIALCGLMDAVYNLLERMHFFDLAKRKDR